MKYTHNYPSDISMEEFEIIRNDLENFKKKTRPRKVDLYDIFCAILYIVKGGIQWRMLPSDYPNWKLVYYYYSIWSETDENNISFLDTIMNKLVKMMRNNEMRKDLPSLGIADSKSVKNGGLSEEKGYDAGKKLPA